MKRVLIIVYYWPPSGGAGVQRWLKFAKYLADFNWQPVVFTPENPDFNLKDESLLDEIPPSVEVIKQPIWEPYSYYRKLFAKEKDEELSSGIKEKKGIASKLANWVRGNVFIPDPKVYWRKPSVEFLQKYLKENPVDVIISSGTPHSMHLIALDLKKALELPWIADFRDPWTELDMLNDYHIHPLRMKKYRKMEKEVLNASDIALTTSKVWASDLKRLGAGRAECITNGYDESDFQLEVEPYSDFVLSHFGLLNHLRNPINLWSSLEELIIENKEFAEKFKLHLGGTIDADVLKEIYTYPALKARTKIFPYLSHQEVIKEYLRSSILLLLLFNSDSGRGNIPGKLFEYLASKKPILAFGPKRGDSADIVEMNEGVYLDYLDSNTSQLKSFILKQFSERRQLSSSDAEYSRKNLTRKLSGLLDQLTS